MKIFKEYVTLLTKFTICMLLCNLQHYSGFFAGAWAEKSHPMHSTGWKRRLFALGEVFRKRVRAAGVGGAAPPSLCLGLDLLKELCNQVIEAHDALILALSGADGNSLALYLVVTDGEHVGHLLECCFTDLLADLCKLL